jgi:hypothetical protein
LVVRSSTPKAPKIPLSWANSIPLKNSKSVSFKNAFRSRRDSWKHIFSKFKVPDPFRLVQPNSSHPQIGHLPKSMLPFGPGILGKRPNPPAQMSSQGGYHQPRSVKLGSIKSKPTSHVANPPPRFPHRPDPALAPNSTHAPSNSFPSLSKTLQHGTDQPIFTSFKAMYHFFTKLTLPSPIVVP